MDLPREDQYSYLWQSVRNARACREAEDIHLARYVRPQLSGGFEKTPLDKPAINYLWDDTAIKANLLFGNGLFSITHSSSIDWFAYELPKDLKGDQEGDLWAAETVTEDLKTEFKDGGLYLALLMRLYDVGTFGYGALYSYEDPDRPGHMAWEWVPANECFYLLDGKGQCHTFVRPLYLTAHQMIHEYKLSKEKVGQPVLTALANRNHTQKFLVLHIVERRKNAPAKPIDSSEFPWKGVYFYPTERSVLGEHGFMDMPYHVLTWGGSRGNPYPMGIGYQTLPEIRNINATRKKFDRLLEMEADSPVLGPDAGEQPGGEQFRPNPGDFIPNGMSGDGKRLYDLLYNGTTSGRTTVNEVTVSRQLIQEAWHNQLFMMQTQRQMTAEEVRSRDAKILQAMGPFIVFLAADMTAICERTSTYRMMQGAYDPVPAILGPEAELQLAFDGLLAKAQEALQGGQILALIQEGMLIMQLGPEGQEAVLAGTDLNAAYRHLAGSKSIPSGIVHSKEKFLENQKARAADRANAQATEQAPAMAKAANDGAQAMKGIAEANDTLQRSGVA
jgi:hypothetical protein